MNIAFFTDTFLPKIDGIITSIKNSSQELIRNGHRVLIFAPKIRKNQEEIIKKFNPNLEVFLVPGINALFYPDYRLTPPVSPWIVNRLKKFNVDIIHFHTPFTMGFEAILASYFMKKPLISTFHTYFCEPEYLKIVNLHWVPGLVKFGWAYSNFYHNRCDITLSPSVYSANKLKNMKIKCPVEILSNGIPLQTPKGLNLKQKDMIRKKLKLKEHTMIFIGRVSEEKCIDVIIKATKKVLLERKDISLLIIGEGPALKKLKNTVLENNLQDNIIFTGGIPHEELINSGIFEIADFFITASTSENQPMTIIEACMFGLPIIGVDAKGVPEMIKNNGFIAKPGDFNEIAQYMLKLIKNDNIKEKMSVESAKMGKSYDIRSTTAKLLNIYERLINKKSLSTPSRC